MTKPRVFPACVELRTEPNFHICRTFKVNILQPCMTSKPSKEEAFSAELNTIFSFLTKIKSNVSYKKV